MKIKPILVIAGDPKSIFFEIIFKSLKTKIKSPIILICCKNLLLSQMAKFKVNKKVFEINFQEFEKKRINNKEINIINVKLENKNIQKFQNIYIKKCFDIAFTLIKKNFTYKLINGPIQKKTFLKKNYLGITEFISEKFNIKKTGMLIYNEKLSVCPLTTHLPIKLVPNFISKKNIEEKVNLIDNFYKKRFKYKPKIAVTGLNPHCESILKNNEDTTIVDKAVKSLKSKGYNVQGPFSADTVFLKKNRSKFDIILGMYHDQVLSPFKTLFEFDAINLTIGLPFLRVSPDHGPNIKMFEKNKSNPKSFIRCLEFLDKK